MCITMGTFLTACKRSGNVDSLVGNRIVKQRSNASVMAHPNGLQNNLRIYGYLAPGSSSFVQSMDQVNMDQITDLCISFTNPNANGVFTISNDVAQAVVKAHALDVRVHFSIGGGGGPAYWDNLLKPANRTQVISNIRKVLTTYNFDGIDVDLEGDRITTDYSNFIVQLSDTLVAHSKLLSAALASYKANSVSLAAYQRLDFLNVMCYDYVGGPHSHSSFAQFQSDFNKFKVKISASKINMGFPGYAHVYEGSTRLEPISIKSILANNPTAYVLNYKYLSPTKSAWFDGHPVLRQKVAYCLQQGAGGMMLWQMMHDPTDNASSLLKLVNYCAGNPSSNGFDPSGVYSFIRYETNNVIEVTGASTSALGNLQVGVSSGATHQKWTLSATGNEFKLTNVNSGLVMDQLDGTSSGNGVQFVQNSWHGGGNQRFKLVPNELGYYKILNATSNRVASVNANNKLVQASDANGANQKFIIKKQ